MPVQFLSAKLGVLLLSQVALSFGLPFALAPLVIFTAKWSIMGNNVNSLAATVLGGTVTTIIIALNGLLIYQQFR